MDALARLEQKVAQILVRVKELQADNTRLSEELGRLRESQLALSKENESLRARLAKNEAARQEAAKRLKSLLDKLHDFSGMS